MEINEMVLKLRDIKREIDKIADELECISHDRGGIPNYNSAADELTSAYAKIEYAIVKMKKI